MAVFDDEYVLLGGGSQGGIDDEYIRGTGHTGIAIGAHQPYHASERKLQFDTDHDWKTIEEKLEMPYVRGP